MRTLTINLATRGRPELLLETIGRTLPNVARRDTVFMISVDADDEATIAVLNDLPRDPRIVVSVAEREDSLGAKYNRALTFAPNDVYAPMVDYAPYVTPRFDQKLLDAAEDGFPDNIGVVYNAYCCTSELPSNVAVTAGLAERMGFIFEPHFPFSIVDLCLDDMARLIDRISYADVVTDRSKRQPTNGRRDVKFWAVLSDLLYSRRVERAKEIINSPAFIEAPHRRRLLLRNLPLAAQRAGFVSHACRADAAWYDRGAAFESPAEEARYQRIKANGTALLRELVDEAESERRAVAAE